MVEEVFRVLKPGGRLSITDIVSAKQLSQSIGNDPKRRKGGDDDRPQAGNGLNDSIRSPAGR